MAGLDNEVRIEDFMMPKRIHWANVEAEATGDAFEVFKYGKVGADSAKLWVEREMADDPRQPRLGPRRKNAALATDPWKAIEIVKAAMAQLSGRHFRIAAAHEWREEPRAYVAVNGIIDPLQLHGTLPPRISKGVGAAEKPPTGDLDS